MKSSADRSLSDTYSLPELELDQPSQNRGCSEKGRTRHLAGRSTFACDYEGTNRNINTGLVTTFDGPNGERESQYNQRYQPRNMARLYSRRLAEPAFVEIVEITSNPNFDDRQQRLVA
jgi:hypothetical protein